MGPTKPSQAAHSLPGCKHTEGYASMRLVFAMCTAMLSMPPVTVGFPVTRVTLCGHPKISYSPLSLCRSPRALSRALVTKQGSVGATLVPAMSSPVSCPRLLPGPFASFPSPSHTRSGPLAWEQPTGPLRPPLCSLPSCPPASTYQSSRGGDATPAA